MKTFIDYFKELLIIILSGLVLAWLVSCSNRKRYILDEINSLRDSIGVNNIKTTRLLNAVDSAQRIGPVDYMFYETMRAKLVIQRAIHAHYKQKIDSLTMEFYK